jgi:hypothetical protein
MRIVKDESRPCQARVTAAIALHELHSARGDYAIKQTALFTDCKHTKHVCNWLSYYQYLEEHPELARPALTLANEEIEPLPEEFIE